MVFEYRVKNVYGKELVYPANKTAENFAKLIDAKTFNKQQLTLIINELGYTAVQVL